MIILDSSVALRGFVYTAPRTTNLDYTFSWVDHTSSAITPGVTTGTLSSTSATDLVAAPAASTTRQIMTASVYNPDTEPALVQLLQTGSTIHYYGWVQREETLHYENGIGFYITTREGAVKQTSSSYNPLWTLVTDNSKVEDFYPVGLGTDVRQKFYGQAGRYCITTLTGTRTVTSTNTVLVYLGPYVPDRYDSKGVSTSPPIMSLRYRVTTAAVTITWAEAAVYMGYPTGGNATLRLLGTADISGTVNSTGQKTTAVTLNTSSSGVHIPPGIGLWAAFGNQASTAMVLRAGNATRVQAGLCLSAASRPTTAGSTVAWTEDTGAAPWVTGIISS